MALRGDHRRKSQRGPLGGIGHRLDQPAAHTIVVQDVVHPIGRHVVLQNVL
eukprot:CAMPEP_0172406774 /NCGR_PEP_ID=MMETSP1061-20121228/72001_1 /TAXON_ID=37318 /ORGANISM="Pseudo-nitzschia pungens, Strain cf. pungens" /LENGTH=50 /DNA_ID=CAMNT_0013142517 /DNA_START=85 /DNA_END=234 /DNA_ORIENTATION=+